MSDEQPALTPRDALRFILIRYDTDAGMAPGVWEVAEELQRHLAWLQHINGARERDAPGSTSVANRLNGLSSHAE